MTGNRGVEYYLGYFDGERASAAALLKAIPHLESKEQLLRFIRQISGIASDEHNRLAETRIRGISTPAANAGYVGT